MTTFHSLTSNQPPERFYRGGSKIRTFRSVADAGDRVPEDWVGSTTTLFGEKEIGLSHLPNGDRLIDAVTRDPHTWLGPQHLAAYGTDTKLLVKLLDAGERLPVHIHPERTFAHEHLGTAHGKAEAWFIVEGGQVHLGFQRPVSAPELSSWVETQDVASMMSVMHTVSVQPGDTVYVPPGVPHAIGAGVFLVEVQEPEDLSILLEWQDFSIDGPRDGHLGLGFDTALRATNRRGWTPEEIDGLIVRAGFGENTLAADSRQYFRAEHHVITGPTTLEAGFSMIIVLDGQGFLTDSNGIQMELHKGDTVLTPYGAGTLIADGRLSLVRCRPPV